MSHTWRWNPFFWGWAVPLPLDWPGKPCVEQDLFDNPEGQAPATEKHLMWCLSLPGTASLAKFFDYTEEAYSTGMQGGGRHIMGDWGGSEPPVLLF